MRLLLDTHVILDVLLDRPPHVGHSVKVLAAVGLGHATGFVGATSITTIHSLAARGGHSPSSSSLQFLPHQIRVVPAIPCAHDENRLWVYPVDAAVIADDGGAATRSFSRVPFNTGSRTQAFGSLEPVVQPQLGASSCRKSNHDLHGALCPGATIGLEHPETVRVEREIASVPSRAEFCRMWVGGPVFVFT